MSIDPSTLATWVGAALSSGAAVRFVDWLRERSSSAAKHRAARLDAESAVTPALVEMIGDLREEVQRQAASSIECERRYSDLAAKHAVNTAQLIAVSDACERHEATICLLREAHERSSLHPPKEGAQ